MKLRISKHLHFAILLGISSLVSAPVEAAALESAVIATIDLAEPFSTTSAWRFTASQDPSFLDPYGDSVPGEIHLCLGTDSGACDPELQGLLQPPTANGDSYSQHRYLNKAQIVQGASDRPFLLVQTSSRHSADGDQLILTQVLAYRAGSNKFVRVYSKLTGRNNNQDVRYVDGGVLKGNIISVEPTNDAPFGYWVSINAIASEDSYKEVLRYRSATTYGDGNPLAVIDSEMPNILQRLGLWRPGSPLPLPAGPCPKPHLRRMEMWCN